MKGRSRVGNMEGGTLGVLVGSNIICNSIRKERDRETKPNLKQTKGFDLPSTSFVS